MGGRDAESVCRLALLSPQNSLTPFLFCVLFYFCHCFIKNTEFVGSPSFNRKRCNYLMTVFKFYTIQRKYGPVFLEDGVRSSAKFILSPLVFFL